MSHQLPRTGSKVQGHSIAEILSSKVWRQMTAAAEGSLKHAHAAWAQRHMSAQPQRLSRMQMRILRSF